MHYLPRTLSFIKIRSLRLTRTVATTFLVTCVALFYSALSYGDEVNSYLPLKIGTAWVLADDMGTFKIVVKGKEVINEVEYYRVDWTDAMDDTYQSEYWLSKDDGIYVAGKSAFTRTFMYEKPYQMVKHGLLVGERWQGRIDTSGFSDTLDFHVEGKESIKTGIGKVEAIKVVVTGRALKIERWYSKGVGLVKEKSFRKEDNRFVLLNEKTLIRIAELTKDAVYTSTGQDPGSQQSSGSRADAVPPKPYAKISTTSPAGGKTDYFAKLQGTWSVKGEGSENVVTFSPNGTFSGRSMELGATAWRYSGNWSVSGNELTWLYKDNTPQKRPRNTKDIDIIVFVDAEELLLLEEPDGALTTFVRKK